MILPRDVENAIQDWPTSARARFHDVRDIVLRTAGAIPHVTLLETVKWGQPSWLPDRRGLGSTLRAGWVPAMPDHFSLFVHCQTTLTNTMRDLYPDAFSYDGARAMRMDLNTPLPAQAIEHCAHLTLTYHRKTA